MARRLANGTSLILALIVQNNGGRLPTRDVKVSDDMAFVVPEEPAAAAPSIPSAAFRNGHTVEDLVLEALKPMLKEWLDAHLPATVERLVEKEIKRLTD